MQPAFWKAYQNVWRTHAKKLRPVEWDMWSKSRKDYKVLTDEQVMELPDVKETMIESLNIKKSIESSSPVASTAESASSKPEIVDESRADNIAVGKDSPPPGEEVE